MCFSQLKRNLQKKKQVEYIWKKDFLKTARRKQTIQLMRITDSGYLRSEAAQQQSSCWYLQSQCTDLCEEYKEHMEKKSQLKIFCKVQNWKKGITVNDLSPGVSVVLIVRSSF